MITGKRLEEVESRLKAKFEYFWTMTDEYDLIETIKHLEREITRKDALFREATACCENMNVINGRCVYCESGIS